MANREYLNDTEIAQRYPRLIKCMMWMACLARSEAVSCIRDHMTNRRYKRVVTGGCEAVNHYGGTKKVITEAFSRRGLVSLIQKHVNGTGYYGNRIDSRDDAHSIFEGMTLPPEAFVPNGAEIEQRNFERIFGNKD